MPRRWNDFQDIVGVVQRFLADGAEVEESALLPDRATGAMREVDVVVRGRLAGHDLLVGIEATSRKRPADVNWVEAMLSKHSDLPTDRLVLVSAAGFSRPAARKATSAGAIPIDANAMRDQDGNELVQIVPHPLAALLSPTMSQIDLVIEVASELVRIDVDAPSRLNAFDQHGVIVDSVESLSADLVNQSIEAHGDQVFGQGPLDAGTSRLTVQLEYPTVSHPERDLHLRLRRTGELHRIASLGVAATISTEGSWPIQMTRASLNGVDVAYGSLRSVHDRALIVFGHDIATGREIIKLRVRDRGGTVQDYELGG